MAYKACYNCELLFEVDDRGTAAVMPCPQCKGALEPYEPDDEEALGNELYTEEQPTLLGAQVAAPANPAIVSTHAFDGLSAAVREQLVNRGGGNGGNPLPAPVAVPQAVPQPVLPSPSHGSPSLPAPVAVAAAAPVALPAPRPAPVAVPTPIAAPQPVPAAAAKGPQGGKLGGTQILDINDAKDKLDALAGVGPGVEPTMALGAAQVPPADGVRSVRHSDAAESGRSTRIEGLAAAAAVPAPAPARPSPLETPAPVVRDTPPAPLAPIARPTGPPPARDVPTRTVGRPQPQSSSAAPIIAAVLVVLLGGGAAAGWYFFLRKPAPVVVEPPQTPQVQLSWSQQIDRILEDAAARLPETTGAEALNESAYVAGGPEGLATSGGSVPGLPSINVPEPLVQSDGGGEWIAPLKTALESVPGVGTGPLVLALDARIPTRTLTRFAYSGYKAGFRRFGLVVEREGAGARGTVPFTLHLPDAPLPDGGAAVVRIGTLGLHVSIQAKDGTLLSDGNALLPRVEGSNDLDLKALDERLATLAEAHGSVKAAVLYGNPELPLVQLVEVVSRIRKAGGRDRFPELALSVR